MTFGFQVDGRSFEGRSFEDKGACPTHERESDLSTVHFSGPRSGRNDRTHKSALENYSESERQVIQQRLDLLQALGKFVAKDFSVPVLLNEPGKGWHWNFVENVIRVDPDDLLRKPLDFLRFVVAHEGAHRRITRFDLIPEDLIQQPGYAFMSNAIEDPRINNFLVTLYDRLGSCLDVVYGVEERARERASKLAQEQLGHTPRFMLAGFEYISRWYRELTHNPDNLTHELPQEVREVVEKTLDAARESWSYFPDLVEVEHRPQRVQQYQQASHDVNRERVWPEFRKLVKIDIENQQIQEFLKELEREINGSGGWGWRDFEPDTNHRQKIEQELSEDQLRELLEQLGKCPVGGAPLSLDSLSEKTKCKLKEIIEGLSDEQRQKLQKKAERTLRKFEGMLEQDMERLFDQMGTQGERSAGIRIPSGQMPTATGAPRGEPMSTPIHVPQITDPDEYSEEVRRPKSKDRRRYDQVKRESYQEAQQLEQELRRIFRERKNNRERANFRSGRNIDIGKRIREVAKEISPLKSRAWDRREAPLERDYAITLVIDQTGSMEGKNIYEAFKALVTMAEPLARLGLKFEVLGFNSRLNVYKTFKEQFDDQARERMSGLEREVSSKFANNTDDGWALHMASERLSRVNAKRKIIIVCTDGSSNPSAAHGHPFFDLDEVLNRIELTTDLEVIGIGLGAHTQVDSHYRKGISGIAAEELSSHLSKLLQEIIQNAPNR